MSITVTPQNAEGIGTGQFSEYRKTALTRISDFTVMPGTTFETPEGLVAEDEECRIAFDAQGGVYPIRESVFRTTYVRADSDEADQRSAHIVLEEIGPQEFSRALQAFLDGGGSRDAAIDMVRAPKENPS